MAIRLIPVADITVDRSRKLIGGLDDLMASIAELGLLQPIVVTPDLRLVAGLHRLRACEALGWQKIPASIVALSELQAEAAMLDENLVRREMTVLERGEMLRRRKELFEALHPETRRGVAGGLASGAARRGERTTDTVSVVHDLAQKMGRSSRTIEREVRIAKAIPEDLRDQLRGLPIANDLTNLGRLARLPEGEQRAVAKRIVDGQTQSVSQAQKLVIADRVRRRRAPWPSGRYDVLVVDPPWRYDGDRTPYPTMTVEDICALPVGELAADDAVLWLWVTNAMMRHAYTCLDAWGFTEKTVMTWDKGAKGATRSWPSPRTEHVILAVRGKPMVCLTTQTTVLRAPRGGHSEKPDEFFRLVEQLCPSRQKIDIFARKPRKGWAVWGDLPAKKAG